MEYIREAIEKAKKDIERLKSENIYTAEHIRQVEKERQAEIQALAKEYHQNNIYKLQDMKNDVIRKHDPAAAIEQPDRPETRYTMTAEERYKHLSPEWLKLQKEMDERRNIFSYDVNGLPIVEGEVVEGETRKAKTRAEVDLEANQKLLENRRLETEIKAARTADLESELDKLSTNKNGNIDRLNMVAAELRTRGKHNIADQLQDNIEAYNIKEPWRNDPDFIAAEKAISAQEVYIQNGDLLFINEDSDVPIYLDGIFKRDEKAEAQARHDAELAKLDAVESEVSK